jgi:hypothetical protein
MLFRAHLLLFISHFTSFVAQHASFTPISMGESDYLDDNPIYFFFYSEMECKTLEGVASLHEAF